jgi:hypothetical protein
VALVEAEVLVQPDPLVAIFAFLTVSVLFSLYLPFTAAAFVGAAVIVQPDSTLDVKVAPAFGMVSVIFLPLAESDHFPLVWLVLMVSVPPSESVQPLMVGGAFKGTDDDGELPVVPLAEKLVQETVIGIESISPLKVMSVPDLRLPVTVTFGPSVAKAAVAVARTATAVTASVATSILRGLGIVTCTSYWLLVLVPLVLWIGSCFLAR